MLILKGSAHRKRWGWSLSVLPQILHKKMVIFEQKFITLLKRGSAMLKGGRFSALLRNAS